MQLRNNYDKNVYNGDVGYISAVSKAEKTVTVDFDGTPIASTRAKNWAELALAYAVTIHKSQGSEFKAVVMLWPRAPIGSCCSGTCCTPASPARGSA